MEGRGGLFHDHGVDQGIVLAADHELGTGDAPQPLARLPVGKGIDIGFRGFPPLLVAFDEEADPETAQGHARAEPRHRIEERRRVLLEYPLPFQRTRGVRHAVDPGRADGRQRPDFRGVIECILHHNGAAERVPD